MKQGTVQPDWETEASGSTEKQILLNDDTRQPVGSSSHRVMTKQAKTRIT